LANNWYQHLLEWKAEILHLVAFVAGAAITKVYDSWKRIRFVAEDWKLWYVSKDSEYAPVYNENPPGSSIDYYFTIKFFSEKPTPVGLHRFSVLFTKGVLHNRQILFRDDEPRHWGGGRFILTSAVNHERLGEMSLTSHDWAVEHITGQCSDVATIQKADAVWLIAYGANGKKYEWHVTDLKSQM
jgi:hypothetical protein